MNNAQKTGIIVIVFIFITIALILILPELSNTYTYTNPSGEKFTFIKSHVGDITIHSLTAYISYKNDKKNYEHLIPLRNDPRELENILVQGKINDKILNKKYVYITLDPELKGESLIASIEIAKVLGQAEYGVFKIPTEGALIYKTNKTNSTDIPIITCNNANKEIGVIWLNLGKENKIYSIKDCVVIEATDYKSLIKVAIN